MQVVDVLARGYLPVELPVSFTSRPFAVASPALVAPRPVKDWTIPVGLNLARAGSLRRPLSIPNPFSQLRLTEECAAGWPAIEAHLKQSMISLTRPIVGAGGGRALRRRRTLAQRAPERSIRMNRARYVFVSDVSECYASIYTHSIEWALHGKTASKARIAGGGGAGSPLGAKLDSAVRAGQDGQTKGIPISPDTSLLLAEIVLCAIDVQLQLAHPGIERSCMRYIDDIEYYASTQSEAEDVLLSWQAQLANFELAVNPTKTHITEAPGIVEASWRTTLAQFTIRGATDQRAANDIYSFFSAAFELARQHRAEAVLSYAVSRAAAAVKGPLSWAALEQLMLAAAAVDPSCLKFVASAMEQNFLAGHSINRLRVEESLNDLCEYHAKREHGSEVTWALWILRRYGLSLTDTGAASVSRMQDNCALLLLFDLISLGRVAGALPNMASAVARAEAVDAWKSEDWLLGYECARNGWASDAAMRAQPHWDELLTIGVEFFKTAPPVPTAPTGPVPPTAPATGPAVPVQPAAPPTVPPTAPTGPPAQIPVPPPATPPTATPTAGEDDEDELWYLLPPPEPGQY